MILTCSTTWEKLVFILTALILSSCGEQEIETIDITQNLVGIWNGSLSEHRKECTNNINYEWRFNLDGRGYDAFQLNEGGEFTRLPFKYQFLLNDEFIVISDHSPKRKNGYKVLSMTKNTFKAKRIYISNGANKDENIVKCTFEFQRAL